MRPHDDDSKIKSDSDSDEVEVISYSSVCEVVDSYLDTAKIPDDLKKEALSKSCTVQLIIEEKDAEEIEGMLNYVSVFNQLTPEDMAGEQEKDPILRLVCLYITAGEKLKSLAIIKINQRLHGNICCSSTDRHFKWVVLHYLYINNDLEYYQMILPLKYQVQMLQMLYDGQGHEGMERTIALCREHCYWNTMYKGVA